MSLDHQGQEVICDSGDSDNVTRDRFAQLDQPIAVKVATDSACDFITGTGTLNKVKILKAKADAAAILMETIIQWENQTDVKLKVLRSDNGGEFDSKVLAPEPAPPSGSKTIMGNNKHTTSNLLLLNDFTEEIKVAEQEKAVDACQQDCADDSDSIPMMFCAAMRSEEAAQWKLAIDTELENLRRKRAQWVFAKKINKDGSIKFKARYVAKGFNQKEGTDFAHTFAPTATFTSMRVLLTIAAKNNWPIYNFNFVAAYLNAPIDEEVWVQAPEGLDVNLGEACLLQRALYGTKQAARCWWKHLSETLADLGYVSSYYDSSVYTLSNKKDRSIIWVHVDDRIVTGSSDAALKQLEVQLKGSLEIKLEEGLKSMILTERWDGATLHSSPLLEGYTANTEDDVDGINSSDYLSIVWEPQLRGSWKAT
ncbi:hypothetical protein PtA15_5A216 [Puccinia triticina]|uniref:Reverse transcriptase Ty1/copia-type domain-containing protein n=1 Tax=Puccinia triticina TaxID=208348 RepID=A0ABY7CJW4_9BASI|nr:uncharacterized protein PtA15_5A216 [Puccinia triticina]WAQ84643.1 hypothetical protein PtA15_5A216 [Puccinia triticina]